MFEPKVPAVCAVIGFVLSFLIGLISGAAFFIVLLRAVIMAVMFAGLAFGGRFLLQRFVPELLSPADETGDESDDSGNVVNITIGENEKDGMPFSGTGSEEQDSSLPDFLQSARQGDGSGANNPDLQARSDSAGSDSAQGSEPITSVGGIAAGESPSSAKSHMGTGMADGLDVLPDLEDFLPDANGEAESDAVPEKVSSDGSSRFESSDLSGAAVESETMAKAIRTILSRDA